MNTVKRNNAVNGFFPSVMDELFKDWAGGTQFNRATAPVNIVETENSYNIQLMAPGLHKEDFNLEVEHDLLTISAEVKKDAEKEAGKFTRREFSLGSFKRTFTLPETVNADDINAVYENGILSIALPKKEEALPKPKRMIEIS